MGWTGKIAVLGGCALVSFAQPAVAAGCSPLRQLSTIPITVSDSRILVPVRINGTEKAFLLDTGGAFSQVAPSLVEEMHLPTTESSIKLLDLYGRASSRAVRLDNLGLGNMQAHNMTLQVATHDFSGDEHFVGLLAADYMSHYDVELDPANGKLNYFSPDHCEGKVIYWKPPAVAAVPMTQRNQHIQIAVTLNGKPMNAIIDTGATLSVMRASDAKRIFGIDENSPGNVEREEIEGKKSFGRTFDSLDFEGVTVSGLRVEIVPDMIGRHDGMNDRITGSNLLRVDDIFQNDPPLIIGMNVISKLRLYFAFVEGRMYVTPATSAAKAN